MNEIEKAIKSLQNIIEYWTYRPTEIEAAKLAIEALEEKAKKEKGCEYCNNSSPLLDEMGITQIDNVTGKLFHYGVDVDDIYKESLQLNYCPMCGRKLSESNE